MFGKKKKKDDDETAEEVAKKAAAKAAAVEGRAHLPHRDTWFLTLNEDASVIYAGENYHFKAGRSALKPPADTHPRDFALHVLGATGHKGGKVELV